MHNKDQSKKRPGQALNQNELEQQRPEKIKPKDKKEQKKSEKKQEHQKQQEQQLKQDLVIDNREEYIQNFQHKWSKCKELEKELGNLNMADYMEIPDVFYSKYLDLFQEIFALISMAQKNNKLQNSTEETIASDYESYKNLIFNSIIPNCVEFALRHKEHCNSKSKESNLDKTEFELDPEFRDKIGQYFCTEKRKNKVIDYLKEKSISDELITIKNDNNNLDEDTFNKLMDKLIVANQGRLNWTRIEYLKSKENKKDKEDYKGFCYRGTELPGVFFDFNSFVRIIKELAAEIKMEFKPEEIYESSYSKDIKNAINQVVNFIYDNDGCKNCEKTLVKISKGGAKKIEIICERINIPKQKNPLVRIEFITKIPNDFLLFLNDDNELNYPKYTNFNCLEVFLVFFMIISKKFKDIFRDSYRINNIRETYSPLDFYMSFLEMWIYGESTNDLDDIPSGSLIRDGNAYHYIYKYDNNKYASLWSREDLNLQIYTKHEVDNLFQKYIFRITGEKIYQYYKVFNLIESVVASYEFLKSRINIDENRDCEPE
ncbi:MAG: hypothetical protein N4A49_02435 [Marinifilaceae bacterium]|jgi:hypothetical protein|nr:hypothetical protein [Marinifilaceae bacterium]